ncbi:hypothetical protein Tco_0237075 [Tanacetum coccineum]
MNQLGDQEAQILAYSQAVKKLEAQLVTFQKQQLSLNEKLTFQANEIYEKDEKLKRYRRIGMKAVKEKEQLQKTLDTWKDSSKNLWRLINSGMSSNSKVGLGFEIQSNNEVLSYEEEMNFSVFKCSKEDSIGKPLYSRFTKTNDFKGVPHPLSGDYTPSPQDEIDESLYVYGKKGPQEPEPSVSDDRSSEFSTCQSNNSAGSIGTSSEHSVDLESEISRVPSEVYVFKTPSCVSNIKTPRQLIKEQATPNVNRKNWNAMMERELGEGYSFTKKKCFVCGSLSYLIKDCDYYEKKKAREAEDKRVVNIGNGMAKPVWTNANRVNHSNKFVPRSVQLNAGRPNINSVRPNINTGRPNINSVRPNIKTGRTNINSVRPRVNAVSSNINTVRSKQPVPTKTSNIFSPKRPQMNQINQRRDFSKSHSSVRRPFAKTTTQISHSNAVMGNWGSAEHPLKNMVDRVIFDSGCSGHMTGNKDQLEDFEEFNGGSVTFRVPSTSSPLVKSPPPTSTPTPIPETEPEPFEHTFEEPSPVHQHFSPPQEQAQGQMTVDDLLQVVPQLISRIDSLETDLKQTKLTMGNAIVKLVKKVKKLEGILKRRNVVLSDSEEEEPEAQGRKSQDDPLDSLVQGLVTPSTTKVNASGEEQVEDISPNTLEAAKTLSRVASLKPKSIDKGRRYKRRKETKGKKVVSSLVFQEEVDAGAKEVNTAEGVNTGSIKLSTVSEQVSTGSTKMSIPSPDKGQRSSHKKDNREGKAPKLSEETPKEGQKKHISTRGTSLSELSGWIPYRNKRMLRTYTWIHSIAQRIDRRREFSHNQQAQVKK